MRQMQQPFNPERLSPEQEQAIRAIEARAQEEAPLTMKLPGGIELGPEDMINSIKYGTELGRTITMLFAKDASKVENS